jgi:MFS family permease
MSSRWHIVALLIAFSYMTWFNRVSMAVAYDTKIGEQYGVSEEAIGVVYSAFFFSYTLFMTPGGWFIDRFGPKLALAIMGLGSGFFGALTGIAGLPVVTSAGLLIMLLLFIRCAMGLVSAPFYPAASRMTASWMPLHQRAFCNGMIQAAAAVGMASAFPVFGALVDFWDWPTSFLLSGSFTFALAVIWCAWAAERPPSPPNVLWEEADFAPRTPIEAQEQVLAGVPPAAETGIVAGAPPNVAPAPDLKLSDTWATLLGNRSVWLLTISYAAIGYLEYLFFFWMNHYFDKILHLDKNASRIYTMILLLSMGVGMVLGGWLADRLRKSHGAWAGRALVPMVGMTLGAAFLFLGVISTEIAAIVSWLALALLAVGATEAPTWTAAVELGGAKGGTAAAIVNTGGNLGGFVAPFLMPIVSHAVRDGFALSDQAGWQWGISLAGIFCLSGAALWWWIRPEE